MQVTLTMAQTSFLAYNTAIAITPSNAPHPTVCFQSIEFFHDAYLLGMDICIQKIKEVYPHALGNLGEMRDGMKKKNG